MCLGIPAQVVEIVDAGQGLARVEVGGVSRVVAMACVLDVDHPIESCLGDWVLVHVGFAMSRIDAQEARCTLHLLAGLGELQHADAGSDDA